MASGSSRQLRWGSLKSWIERPFLTRQEKASIAAVVAEQEQRTLARIHVYVKAHTSGADFLAHAQRRFGMLGLHKKAEGRGGDALHAGAGQDLWDRARDTLAGHLAAGRAEEGIEACVRALGDELARRFPRPGDDVKG